MGRFCFKSGTCQVKIPEIDFETGYGDATGIYSTIEGVIAKFRENFKENYPFVGDSANPG